jgi:hypothetical protein
MKARVAHRGDALARRVLCHDVGRAFRKGHTIRAEDVPALEALPWDELHLLELEDDVGQREAGQQLAAALCSEGLQALPSGHRHVLKALHDGLVKIDVAALQRMNSVPGIAVYTMHDGAVAAQGRIVAEAQITGLAIERAVLDGVEGAGVIRLLPFAPRDVVVWMRDESHIGALETKLRGFGCSVTETLPLQGDAAAIRASLEQAASPLPAARGEGGRRPGEGLLFLVSGSNALDPLDPVFAALNAMGATMQRVGLPVHPGTLLWIAAWRSIDIIGLPTCGLGTQRTAFDLILPRLLAEGAVRDEELAALGHGGIL